MSFRCAGRAVASSIAFILGVGLAIGPAPPASCAEIHRIAGEGDLEAVKTAIAEDPELVHARGENDQTPLFFAGSGSHLAVMKFLIASGADVNAGDEYLDTPLHMMAYKNLTGPMKVLLESGAKINARNHGEQTPLHYAALADRSEAVALLVEAGADLDLKDDYGRTPLVLCARERGGPQTIKILLEAGADLNLEDKYDDDALDLAAWRGKEDMVNLLLDAGAKLPAGGAAANELFEESASHGLKRLFEALIEAGGDPGFALPDGRSLVHAAAAGGSVEILQGLASRGLEIDQPDLLGWRPLHYAARDGRTGCVEWLVKKNVEINSRTLMGQTAYNISVEREMTSVSTVLKVAGADTGPVRFPALKGPYLGQDPPGETPKRFAVGIVSSVWGLHSTVTFSPAGDMALWAPMVEYPGEIYSRGTIMLSRQHQGRWTRPEWAPFLLGERGDVGFFAPDGGRVYFLSRRTLPEEPDGRRERIWYADRTTDGWAAPRLVDPVVNDYPQHWQFSVDGRHAIYFSSNLPEGQGQGDIYRSAMSDGKWQRPVNLGPPVNTPGEEATPFISPDGSYLIFQREGDLFLSFATADGGWSAPEELDPAINSSSRELCPFVSADGKYLFFVSRRDGSSHVYWVSASFIEEKRPQGTTQERTDSSAVP
jgi:ankyrin repeat protein